MTRITQVLVIVVCLLLQPVCFATVTKSKQLKSLAREFLVQHQAEEHITALAMTVQSPQHAKPISIYAGTTGQNQTNRVTKQSLFQVGSIGKSFITAILLKLASDPRNHFSIHDHIDKYFPQYKKWHAITVEELMNMTSGIPDYIWDEHILTSYAQHPYTQQATNAWINHIYRKSLGFKPGTQFQYSNTNYLILGNLVEKISGHTLTDEINATIIKPLGLTHTYFVANLPDQAVNKNLVHGYQNQQSFLPYIPRDTDVTHYSLSYLGGAGAVISTTTDITKWVRALFTPGKFLTKNELKHMLALISQKTGHPVNMLSYKDPYAFGLGIGVQYGAHLKTAFYIYEGYTFGYRALYIYVPTRGISIVVAVNSDYKGSVNHLTDLVNRVGAVELA